MPTSEEVRRRRRWRRIREGIQLAAALLTLGSFFNEYFDFEGLFLTAIELYQKVVHVPIQQLGLTIDQHYPAQSCDVVFVMGLFLAPQMIKSVWNHFMWKPISYEQAFLALALNLSLFLFLAFFVVAIGKSPLYEYAPELYGPNHGRHSTFTIVFMLVFCLAPIAYCWDEEPKNWGRNILRAYQIPLAALILLFIAAGINEIVY